MNPLKKKKSPEEEKWEQAIRAEAELSHLRHTYAIMDAQREAFLGGCESTMARQKNVLMVLKAENKNIKSDLSIAQSKAKKKQDNIITHGLKDLLSENKEFTEKVAESKVHIKEIRDQIQNIEQQAEKERAVAITDEQIQRRILSGEKALDIIENRLDTQVKKFCMILTENRHLKEDIDHLLMERKLFNKQWDQLILNLTIGRKFMLDLIEQATLAYDQREEWCSKLHSLRERAHRDLILDIEEMCEIQGEQDNQGKAKDFFEIKGQKRLMSELEERTRWKRAMQRREMEKTFDRYESIWSSIKNFTGHESLELVAKEHSKIATDNFSRLQGIIAVNHEMEMMSMALTGLHIEIDKERHLEKIRRTQQKQALNKLKSDLAQSTKQADQVDAKFDAKNDHLDKLMSGIMKMFNLMNCSKDPLLELLGNQTGEIHIHNVLIYLGIVEHQINDYLINVYFAQNRDKRKAKKPPQLINDNWDIPRLHLTDHFVPTTPCPLCVQCEQVSDVIDSLQVALSRDEITANLKNRLALPGGLARLHNVSACNLPESRKIMQKRYL